MSVAPHLAQSLVAYLIFVDLISEIISQNNASRVIHKKCQGYVYRGWPHRAGSFPAARTLQDFFSLDTGVTVIRGWVGRSDSRWQNAWCPSLVSWKQNSHTPNYWALCMRSLSLPSQVQSVDSWATAISAILSPGDLGTLLHFSVPRFSPL